MQEKIKEFGENYQLVNYFQICWKRKWLILLIGLVTVSVMAIKTYSAIPLYESACQILIEKEHSKILSFDEVYQTNIWDADYHKTQYKILTSRTLVKKAFDKLHFEKEMSFDDFRLSYRIEPVRDTRMASIIVRHPNPDKAALASNTIAGLYIDQNLDRRLQAARYAVGWLTQQLETHLKKVEEAEFVLQKYVESNNIVSLPSVDISVEQSVLLNVLEKEKLQLETELSELSKRYKEKHPRMIRTTSQLMSVSEKLEKEKVNILDLRQKQIQYGALKREVESNEQLYNTLLNRTKETDLFEGLRTNNISIVDAAEAPPYPVWPNKSKNLLMSLFLSLFFGIGFAFLLEHLDNTFKNDNDVEQFLKLPVLGYIPKASVIRKRMSDREIALACFDHPQSTFAEAYRYVRTGISFSAIDKPYPCLLISSTCPKEGKTTEAINLAITMASLGDKVLLIDADARKPAVHKAFQFSSQGLGLSDYLCSNVSEESVIQSTQIPNLSVIQLGKTPPNPAELLGSQKMKVLLEWGRKQFQRVIVDSSPIIAVADSIVLSRLVDGIIYIIKANKTTRKSAIQCISRLMDSRAKILGVVLNQVTPKGSGYYYQYYDYYQEGNGKRPKKHIDKMDKQSAPSHPV